MLMFTQFLYQFSIFFQSSKKSQISHLMIKSNLNDQYLAIQIPEQYYEVEKTIHQYKEVLCNRFRGQQQSLIEELQNKAKSLKEKIAFYKKQTSQENIEKLVSKKRYQKETERLQLQIQWRNLTQKYKKLQEQQKKINEQNQQAEFDLNNLKIKIEQLQNSNIELQKNIDNLKKQTQNFEYLTEVNLQSRQNSSNFIKHKQITKKRQYELTSNDSQKKKNLHIFSSKFKQNKTCNQFNIKKQTNSSFCQWNKKPQNFLDFVNNKSLCKPLSTEFKIFKSQDRHLTFDPNRLSHINDKKQFCVKKQQKFEEKALSKKFGIVSQDQKYSQLMNYLARKDVRDKIFDILRK